MQFGVRRPVVKPRTPEEDEAHARLVFGAFNRPAERLLMWKWRREVEARKSGPERF